MQTDSLGNPFVFLKTTVMNKSVRFFLLTLSFWLCFTTGFAQDTTQVFKWNVTSLKLENNQYQLNFTTSGANGWQLYAPNQVLSEVPTAVISFSDSAIKATASFVDSGAVQTEQSLIFENTPVKVYTAP